MSNFAERLVARSTGRALDPRVSLLMPRPIARFEQSGLEAPGEGPLQNLDMSSPDSADALPGVGAPQPETEPRDVIASAERADRGSLSPSKSTPDDALGHPLHQSPLPNAGSDDGDAYPQVPSAGETTGVRSAR